MNWLNFEIAIMDCIYNEHITNADKLRSFSDELHQHLELAVEDYVQDNRIKDYIPVY